MKVKYVHPADQVVDSMTRLYNRNMTTITGGNISVRDENGDTWISPTRLDKGHLKTGDICVLRKNGELEGQYKPSIEYRFHLGLLDYNPNINAVIHAHCPDATAFCALDRYPNLKLWHDARALFKEEELGRVPYSKPGSDELRDAVVEQGKQGKTVIFMDNHGILVGGKDIYDAWAKIEIIEKLATIDLVSARIGAVKEIKGDAVEYDDPIEVRPADEAECTVAESIARKELAHYAARAYGKHIVSTISGSFSIRVGENAFVITADNADLLEVEPRDIVLVKDGVAYGGKPNKTWKIHEGIYAKDPGINSIYTITPLYGMAWAASQEKMDLSIYMGLVAYSGMKTLPYEASVQDVVDAVTLENSVALVSNRFYVVATRNAQRSFNESESLEDFAMVEARAGVQKWLGLKIHTEGE